MKTQRIFIVLLLVGFFVVPAVMAGNACELFGIPEPTLETE